MFHFLSKLINLKRQTVSYYASCKLKLIKIIICLLVSISRISVSIFTSQSVVEYFLKQCRYGDNNLCSFVYQFSRK